MTAGTRAVADPGGIGSCPVCRADQPQPFLRVGERDYWRCVRCEATFLDPSQRLPPQDEYAHYLHHENDPDDARYRRFLAQLATPLLGRLGRARSGIDYGCGPGPALAAMMREAGHAMAVYDPFFYPDPAPLERRYDFVTCTEVAEHFHHPADEFDRFDRMLRPGGWVGVMTSFLIDDARFAEWRYRQDPTHVVFYRGATLRSVAARRGWTCEIPVQNVALMRKPDGGAAAA